MAFPFLEADRYAGEAGSPVTGRFFDFAIALDDRACATVEVEDSKSLALSDVAHSEEVEKGDRPERPLLRHQSPSHGPSLATVR